jgi:hypothetical protein
MGNSNNGKIFDGYVKYTQTTQKERIDELKIQHDKEIKLFNLRIIERDEEIKNLKNMLKMREGQLVELNRAYKGFARTELEVLVVPYEEIK